MLKNLSLGFSKARVTSLPVRNASSKNVVDAHDYQLAQTKENTNVYCLGNNLRVACFGNDSDLSSTAIHVEAGTRDETAELNGVSNFIARLAGKGTSSIKQEELQMKLSKLGATLDINVNREYTSFVVTGFSKDTIEHAKIVSDVVKNSVFDENDINKEREAILKHVKKQQSDIPLVTMDYLYSVAYQGTPMSHTLSGSSKNIEAVKRKHILGFMESHYKAPRMVLTSVGGNVNLDKLAEAAEKNLNDVSTKYPTHIEQPQPCRFTAMEVQHRDDDLPLAHVAIGFNGCAYNSPDRIPLMLLTEMMGSHDKSHGALCQGLDFFSPAVQSPKDGLFAVRGFSHFYSDCGLIGSYYVAKPEDECLDNAGIFLGKFWMNLCHNLMDTQLVRSKRSLRRKLIQDMYDPSAVQNKLAQDIFFGKGRPETVEEMLARLESVTVSQLEEVAHDYFHDQDFARSAYGPTEGLTDYNRMRSNLYWVRW